jgi:hypothetical protein
MIIAKRLQFKISPILDTVSRRQGKWLVAGDARHEHDSNGLALFADRLGVRECLPWMKKPH